MALMTGLKKLCGWSENRDLPWPKLLDFWGLPNLQVINRDAHAAKCHSLSA